MTEKEYDIYEYMNDAGVKPYPPKPQLSRGGFLFTCPICKTEINSHSFLYASAFEDSCNLHMMEHKNHPVEG